MEVKDRLMSIDALRGFDMFFITGGASLIVALCTVCGAGDSWLVTQMRHVPWAGIAHHDTIFPLFLFLAGVSWPFSLASQLDRGRAPWQIRLRVLKRMSILFLMGLSFGGFLAFNPNFRLMSVLGFIGISWGLAALIFMQLRKDWMRLATAVAILIGYWALLRFGIAPNAPAGADSYCKEWNIISWFDKMIYPNHLLQPKVYDPESLFSTINGTAMALLGMCAGSLLKRKDLAPSKKALSLFLASLATLAAALVFTFLLGDQIVKALWTTSFVLSAATYSLAMLALFYWIIDVKGYRKWTLYFRVIGMNAITIYFVQMVGLMGTMHNFLFKGLYGWVGDPWGGVVRYATYCAVVWGFLYFLYRKNLFLKV